MSESAKQKIPLDALVAAMVVGLLACERFTKYRAENPDIPSGEMLDRRAAVELGAALTIREWELRGLVRPEMQLPSAKAEIEEILRDNFRPSETSLALLVGRSIWNSFSWKATVTLGTEVVISPVAEEEIAAPLAEWLWRFRHYA